MERASVFEETYANYLSQIAGLDFRKIAGRLGAEMTGEEIGIKRLIARPVATLCVEVQEQQERYYRGTARYAVPC